MGGSGITLSGELVHISPAGVVLKAPGGQIVEVPAAAVVRARTEGANTVVDLAPAAQLVVRAPTDRGWFLSSDVFDRVSADLLDDGGGGSASNCNCNCNGSNCNCNCNCNSVAQVEPVTELPRLRRQLG